MGIFSTIAIVVVIVLILGAIFIGKSVSMYKKSEKDKKYDDMLKQPLEKFGDDHADTLAEKYEDNDSDNNDD